MALKFLSPIHNTSRYIDLYLEDRGADLGLGPTEGHLLLYLRSYSPVSVSRFHTVSGIKRSTLTSIFDRMVSRGWITRESSPRDRRQVLIDLTGAGRRQADGLRHAMERLEEQISESVTPEQLRGFVAVVSTISEIVNTRAAAG
jgi:DNA-binding MarR family transcriptional regulator